MKRPEGQGTPQGAPKVTLLGSSQAALQHLNYHNNSRLGERGVLAN
jgi:hypothetical protein